MSVADPHSQPVEACLAALGSTSEGLSSVEAQTRLKSHGPNLLPQAPARPLWLRFLSHFNNPLSGSCLPRNCCKAMM